MRKYCLVLIVVMMNSHETPAEIKNGYKKDIRSVRHSLKGLQPLLHDKKVLPTPDRRKIEHKIKLLADYISYYEITEKLLNEFQMLAPKLYQEINLIQDRKGRRTDVYVKFISKDQAVVQAAGTTCLSQATGDNDAYSSEYGENTVSIKIWVISKALWVLAHEFGHVKYQVPNLQSYVEFHRSNYSNRHDTDPNRIGHKPNDPSGKNALLFEKQFRLDYARHLKNGYEPVSPVVLLHSIARKVETELTSVN